MWSDFKAFNRSCKGLNVYSSGTLAGKKFAQATPANMPWKSSDGLGVRFDGVSDLASNSVGLSFPIHIFMLASVLATAGNNYLLDGGPVTNKMAMFTSPAGTTFQIYAGNLGPAIGCANNTMQVFEAVFNGPSSKVAVNGGAFAVGNAGDSGDPTFFTIGAAANGTSSWANMVNRKTFIVEGELSPTERAHVANYMLRAAR